MEPTTNLLSSPRSHTGAQPMRGFTMVEMLVSLGIILVITTIVLLSENTFNKNLVLVDTAYTVAFTLRQAQSFGLSSRKSGVTQNAGYGVHFVNNSLTSYRLFADTTPASPGSGQGGMCPGHSVSSGLEARPGNCLYDGISESVTVYNLNKGFKVSRFCGVDTGGQTRCSGGYLDSLTVSFLRPSTQAVMLGTRAGALVELVSARIHVTSPDGMQERCISVSKVGQIAVGACP